MSETITAKDFRDILKASKPLLPLHIGLGNGVKIEGPDTKQLLRMMGDYFELDRKAVNFWIRQMELDKKL